MGFHGLAFSVRWDSHHGSPGKHAIHASIYNLKYKRKIWVKVRSNARLARRLPVSKEYQEFCDNYKSKKRNSVVGLLSGVWRCIVLADIRDF